MSRSAFEFRTATEIQFGRGQAKTVAARLAAVAPSVLLVHGASPERVAWLHGDLRAAGVTATGFACPREPDVALIEAGVAAARRAGVQAVVALGGGSVIDAGKAIAALAPATGSMLTHLEVVGEGRPLTEPPLYFAALPTTAGTGAEVTKNAVIRVPEARRKVSLRDNRMLPDLALVDPALTDGLPKAVTLASGLDAVTQVIEPYLSSRANRMTDALCRDAIPIGLNALVRLMDGEDQAARDDLAWTSLCGGLALANAGLGAVHGLAGPLGGMSPAPHGAVCGVLLPHALETNAARGGADLAPRMAEVRAWIAAALGCDADRATDELAGWSAFHGLPTLGAMGVLREELPAIAEAAQSSSSMRGNPVALSATDLVTILEAAY